MGTTSITDLAYSILRHKFGASHWCKHFRTVAQEVESTYAPDTMPYKMASVAIYAALWALKVPRPTTEEKQDGEGQRGPAMDHDGNGSGGGVRSGFLAGLPRGEGPGEDAGDHGQQRSVNL